LHRREHMKEAIKFEQFVFRLLKAEASVNDQVLLAGAEAGRLYRFVDAVAPDGFIDLPGPCLIEIKFRALMDSLRSFIQRIFQSRQEWASVLFVVNEPLSKARTIEDTLKKDYPNIKIKVYSKNDILELKKRHPEVGLEFGDSLFIESIVGKKIPRQAYLNSLRSAFEQDQLVLFLGAGVSHSGGMPAWSELLNRLINLLIKEKLKNNLSKEDETEIVNYFKSESPDSPLIIARILRDALDDKFPDYVRKALYQDFHLNKSSSTLIEEIANLCIPQRGHQGLVAVVNYNFGELLELELEKKGVKYLVIVSEEDTPTPNELPIYHPHGFLPHKGKLSEKWRSSLVLSEDAYHSQFIDSYSWANITQLNLLRNNVCLFVGFSMKDPNLRRLLEISQMKKSGLRHYVILKNHWKPTKKTTKQITKTLADIFKSLEERSLAKLGISIWWVDDYDEIPKIFREIRK